MKNKNVFWFFGVCASFLIMGCTSAVPYSFAENESRTATITFTGTKNFGVDLFYYEGIELPIPKKSEYWNPVTFPAGRPFTLTVGVYNSETERGDEVTFNCPALAAGRDYRLEAKKPYFGKVNRLVLTDMNTRAVVYEQQVGR